MTVVFRAVLCRDVTEFNELSTAAQVACEADDSSAADDTDEVLPRALARSHAVALTRWSDSTTPEQLANLLAGSDRLQQLLKGQALDVPLALVAVRFCFFEQAQWDLTLRSALQVQDPQFFTLENLQLQARDCLRFLTGETKSVHGFYHLRWYKNPHLQPRSFLAELNQAFLPHLKQLQQEINRAKTQETTIKSPTQTDKKNKKKKKPSFALEMGEDASSSDDEEEVDEVWKHLRELDTRAHVRSKPAFKNNRWVQMVQVACSIEPDLSFGAVVKDIVKLRLALLELATEARARSRHWSYEQMTEWLDANGFDKNCADIRDLPYYFFFANMLLPALELADSSYHACCMRAWCHAHCNSNGEVTARLLRQLCPETWWREERCAVLVLLAIIEVTEIASRYCVLPLWPQPYDSDGLRSLVVFLYCPICNQPFTDAVTLRQKAPVNPATTTELASKRVDQVDTIARCLAGRSSTTTTNALALLPRRRTSSSSSTRSAGSLDPYLERKLASAANTLQQLHVWEPGFQVVELLQVLQPDSIMNDAAEEEARLVQLHQFETIEERERAAGCQKAVAHSMTTRNTGSRNGKLWEPSLGPLHALICGVTGTKNCSRASARTQPVCTFVTLTAVDLRQTTFSILDRTYGLCCCCQNVAAISPRRYSEGFWCAVCWHNYLHAQRKGLNQLAAEATLERCLRDVDWAGM